MNKTVMLFLLLTSFFYAQEFRPAIPDTDIDSLICNTEMYEILARTVTETAFRISFSIDSSGIAKDLSFSPMFKEAFGGFESVFISKISPKLEKINWVSATYNDQNVNSKYTIPFILFFTNSNEYLNRFYGNKCFAQEGVYSSSLKNSDYSAPIIKNRDAPIELMSVNHNNDNKNKE